VQQRRAQLLLAQAYQVPGMAVRRAVVAAGAGQAAVLVDLGQQFQQSRRQAFVRAGADGPQRLDLLAPAED